MAKLFLIAATLLGFSATATGAFAAHILRERLGTDALRIIETGVHYQFWHALALLAVGILMLQFQGSRLLLASGALFIAGILLFSGSLYVLGISELRQVGPLPVGLLTPIGGSCLLVAWLLLGIACWRLP